MRVKVAAILAVISCGTNENNAATEGEKKPVLRIGGAESMMSSLLPALTSTHSRTRGTLEFELSSSNSAKGIGQLLDGELDLAAATRDASPSEEEQAKVLGWSFGDEGVRHIIGVDVTAVSVHPDNPVTALTYDQVIGVFCTQTIDNWSFLGFDDLAIKPMTLDPSSGERALFEDFFCGPRGIHARVEEASATEIASALGSDPAAISYVSLSQSVGRVVPLQPDPTSPPIQPSQQNIIRGAYPLYRDVYLFTRGPAAGYTRSLLDWISSPAGQEVVDEQNFVPLFLRPERLDDPRPLRETIHFDQGSSVPNQRSLARLQLLVEEIRERKLEHVVLEGYTDNREENAYPLSEERANTVKALLAEELPDLFFEIIPRGAKNPLAPNDTPYGRLRNRRVQIYLARDEKAEDDDVVVESGDEDPNGG
ncbi:MAG TPA: hypothetical protein ENK18_05225 [Deltaproteobacteria bacterium]|nr:hypothetical protein [Deltaproteobacteria bacterium]